MEHDRTKDRNYWQLLAAARDALREGDFAAAERLYAAASVRRDQSPGRVFLTESLADGLGRLLRRRRRTPDARGRWDQRTKTFRGEFLAAGEATVREGLRLAELRPEDDADANQPVIEAALFLVVRSRIFAEEPASAVPLLKGLFRTAVRSGHLFDVQLIRHDVPLTEEDRLWLARRGGDLLDVFVDQGELVPASGPAREWAAAILQLLHPRYFGQGGRLGTERAWLEAVSADRLQGDAAESVRLYRAYLEVSPGPGPRADEARVRILELLANADQTHFPAPRYREALGALQSAGLAPGSEQAGRYRTALARIEYRRPEADAIQGDLAWATAALGGDGTVTTVFWWGGEPRDVARWRPGDDTTAIGEFLEACGDRILARDDATIAALGDDADTRSCPWPVEGCVAALAESLLPRDGLSPEFLGRLARPEVGPWRAGWRSELGHPELSPPDEPDAELRNGGGLGGALLAGLVVLALRTLVTKADPALRAGLGELARRGNAAAGFLYRLLTLGDEAARAMDSSFAAWTLPLLWTRPDPLAAVEPDPGPGGHGSGGVPDLGRNDVAIVTTGEPAGVLAAWGAERGRWRVVLDRLDRLDEVARAAARVIGPSTVIPRDGRVHRLAGALVLLEDLAAHRDPAADPDTALLAVFHWTRLVTTHNGDLLDYRDLRPRRAGAYPLHDRYAEVVADLEREDPRPAADATDDGWGVQFAQRVRKAGFVAGQASLVTSEPERLDALWGVFTGADTSWVFLDSAVVHARLAAADPGLPERLHARLVARGRRHLSLLTGAVWCRSDLEDLLAEWLRPYGPAYRLALTDLRAPALLLADRGAVPGGRHLAAEALAAALAHVGDGTEAVDHPGELRVVAVPAREPATTFWRAARDGRFAVAADGWRLTPIGTEERAPGPDAVLCVPELAALATGPEAATNSLDGWKAADATRARWSRTTRRACSLEIACYLAGGWSAVEIADVRWWRLLRDTAGEAGRGIGAWDGGRAATAATGGRARCFDLPETSGDALRRLAPGLVAEVAAWLAGRGGGAATPEAPASWPAPGRRLVTGDEDAVRRSLLMAAGAAWERGHLGDWILVVSRTPWSGAADIVAAAGIGGAAVWPTQDRPPAPVLWAQPADLASAAFQDYVRRHRPRAVVVPRLDTWLPGPQAGAQAEAAALRALLGLDAPTVILMAAAVPASWRAFLAEATDLGPTEGPEAAPAPADGGPAEEAEGIPSPMLTARMKLLFNRLRPLLKERDDVGGVTGARPDLDGELVPVARLATLAGVAPGQVRGTVRVLRWIARLAGDPLSQAGCDAGRANAGSERTHTLLIGRRFVELEAELVRLDETVSLYLPLWLGRVPAGGRTWIDLAQPPAQPEPGQLAHLDAFLLSGGAEGTGLSYTAPRGALNSTRRLATIAAPEPEVRNRVRENLDLYRRRVQDVLAGAVETGSGFLVDTGLSELRPEEQAFLTVGVALDFWRWFGPGGPDSLHLVDLLTLADSPTVRSGSAGWTLVGRVCGVGRSAGPQTALEPARGSAGRLRGLLGYGDRKDARDPAVTAVAGLAGLAPAPTLLVLRGAEGSGRTRALVDGLALAARRGDDPGDVTVYCPDTAVAAACCRHAARVGLPLDVRLPALDSLPASPPAGLLAAGRDDVVVMPGVERFAPEQRYQIAQLGRGRRLLMTVDPAATAEAWENLFLTTPRVDDVLEVDESRDQSRRIVEQLQHLVPGTLSGTSRPRRRDKGQILAEYAANLDHGVARIVSACREGLLPPHLRLVAPLPADLAYVAGALRDQGWLVIDEEDLERLLLPGPCEVLAAAADLLAVAGDAPAAGEAEAPADAARGWLAALPRRGDGPCTWPTALPSDPDRTTLADVAAHLLADGDAAPALAQAAARRRLEDLLGGWGGRMLAELPADPLWQAWKLTAGPMLDRQVGPLERPFVLLATVDRPPATAVPGGVYLCLGTEPPRQHYRILAWVRDTALILYQDRSPLAGE